MPPIRVIVHGSTGRMGKEALVAISGDSELELVGAVARSASEDALQLPEGFGSIPYSADLDALVELVHPDVIVDFTVASAALAASRVAAARGVHFISGTSGLAADALAEMGRISEQAGTGVIVAPNFALGAVLLMHLAKISAPHFDFAEIIELHHEKKVDAPSGTALATAQAMAEAHGGAFDHNVAEKVNLPETRGGVEGGVPIHSVRLPGLLAHQEVIFGLAGQTLTIRHDTSSRECYMPGVVLAVKKVSQIRGLVHGLEPLLGLG